MEPLVVVSLPAVLMVLVVLVLLVGPGWMMLVVSLGLVQVVTVASVILVVVVVVVVQAVDLTPPVHLRAWANVTVTCGQAKASLGIHWQSYKNAVVASGLVLMGAGPPIRCCISTPATAAS